MKPLPIEMGDKSLPSPSEPGKRGTDLLRLGGVSLVHTASRAVARARYDHERCRQRNDQV